MIYFWEIHEEKFWCQFGCGISKIVGPKSTTFGQEPTFSKGKKSVDVLKFDKKCQNRTLSQTVLKVKIEGFLKKNLMWISI